jgi:hypothetical protein
MEIEFKEKTYEKYFGHEIAQMTNISFSPDQCDEEILGFDEAFFVPERWFRLYGPYVRRRRLGRLTGVEISEFNETGKFIAKHMPPFRFNVFVQFKRPQFLTSRRSREWSDWKKSYYRYATTPHQQEALERIEKQSQGRAATIYASPAFWKADDLWNHVSNNKIINHSNMANALKLKGHKKYSYVSPGHIGKGHSETVEIASEDLAQVLSVGLERNEPLALNQHIKRTATEIIEATSGSDLVSPVFYQVKEAMGFENLDPTSLYDAILVVKIFSHAFDLRCFSVG